MRNSTVWGSVRILISILFSLTFLFPVAQATVFINEVLPNGLFEPQSEWVELYNDATTAVSLNEWNITEQGANSNITFNITIPANGFLLLVRDFSVFNATFPDMNGTGLVVAYGALVPSFQLGNTAGNIMLYNTSGELVDNVSYSSSSDNVSFGRYVDGSSNIITLPTLTPLSANDAAAPTVNRWVVPPSNNSNIAKLVNITLNATDDASGVQSAILTINSSTVFLQQNGDLWYYEWDTLAMPSGKINLTVIVNDSFGQEASSTLLNITIDNQNPSATVTSPPQAVNISGMLNITAIASDALTAIGSVQARNGTTGNWVSLSLVQGTFGSGTWSATIDTKTLADGAHTFTINATDVLGNQNASESAIVTIDNTPPTIGSVSINDSIIIINDDVLVSVSFADANGIKSAVFEHNASGTRQNVTGTRVSGDNFSLVISSSLFNSRELIGWKAYGTDYAGNVGESSMQTFSIINRAPISSAILDQSWPQNTNLTINLLSFFSDPDGDALSFSAISSPQNITFVFAGNTVRFVPDRDFFGTRTISINTTDGEFFNTSNIFLLNVTFVNTYAPQVSTIPNITFAEDGFDATLNLSNFVFDQDTPDDQISWSAQGNTNIIVTVDATTKIANFTAAANFNGTEILRLVANDGTFQTVSGNITVMVTPVNDAPTTPVLIAPVNGANLLNNSVTLSWNVANDLDGQTVGYIVSFGTGALPQVNSTVAGTSLLLSNLQAGQTYFWRVASTDGIATSANSIVLSFTINANNTPLAPQFTTVASGTGQVGQQYAYDADATDSNGDILTFSLLTAPNGMSINPASGMITWTPLSSQQGSNQVSVQVTDGTFNIVQNFNVFVNPLPSSTVISGGKLAITDMEVKVDGNSDKSVNNGSTISKEAKPDSEITFKIEVENLFNRSEDLEIENIEIDIFIEEIDDGDDLDEESDEFDLDQGDSETADITFKLPLEIEEDTYTVRIIAEGEDTNGTIHVVEATVFLEVEKEEHELRIVSASSSHQTLRCEEAVHINVNVVNTGQEDEDEAKIKIESLAFGWLTEELFEIEEGDEGNRFEQSFQFIVPRDLDEGPYPVEITTYYDSTRVSETKTLMLQKDECVRTEQATVQEQANIEQERQKQIEEAQKSALQQQQAQQQQAQSLPFKDSKAYEFLLVSMFITASIVFVLLLVAVVVVI